MYPPLEKTGNVTGMTTQRSIVLYLHSFSQRFSLFQLIQREEEMQNSYDTAAIYQRWNLRNGRWTEHKEHFQSDPPKQSLQPRETNSPTFIHYCLLHEENTFMGGLCFLL